MGNLRRQTKAEAGRQLERTVDGVKKTVLDLVSQYRDPGTDARLTEDLIRQAVDTPSRVQAMVKAWIDEHDAAHGAGAGVALINECLAAAGSSETAASINTRIDNLIRQAQAVVDAVKAGTWTYDDAADHLETALTELAPKGYVFDRLKVPDDYIDIWGDPWFG